MKNCIICKSKVIKTYQGFSIPLQGRIKTLKDIKQYRCTNRSCNQTYIDSHVSLDIDRKIKDVKKE